MIIPTYMTGKKVAILGLGRSGMASAHALITASATVYAHDDHSPPPFVDGMVARPPDEWPWHRLDALVISPGIPVVYPKPHPAARLAQHHNVPIISDIEMLMHAKPKAKIIGITGTNGKSTIAALTAHILRENGIKTVLGGNIGTAVLDLDDPGAGGVIVLELSSYQLDITPSLRLDAAAIANITPDHLDRHGGWQGYVESKALIAKAVKKPGTLIIGHDEACGEIAKRYPEVARPIDRPCVRDVLRPPSLRGEHNAENIATALQLINAAGITIDADAIDKALVSYQGLPHRMEWIGQRDSIDFINDSKATNGVATAKALQSFPIIYWIAGGQMKEDGLGEAMTALAHVRRAYLIGSAAPIFEKILSEHCSTDMSKTVVVAAERAFRDATREHPSGATVLLSPAAASFDQFDSFEHRGEAFRSAAQAIISSPSDVREGVYD